MSTLKQAAQKRYAVGRGTSGLDFLSWPGERHDGGGRRRRKAARNFELPLLCGIILTALCSCSREPLRGSVVLSQSLTKPVAVHAPVDILDLRYPAGSRIVLADANFKQFEVLSKGFFAAGDPQVSCDAKCVVFCGKLRASDEWQIYQVEPGSAQGRPLTMFRGGAMSPALLPENRVVFASPVPKLSASNSARALYVTRAGEQARQLTFTPSDLSDPSVLSDGRVLFVEHRPRVGADSADQYALLTINNDGTEVTQFSALMDSARPLARPHELADGRVALLVRSPEPGANNTLQFISAARPFASPTVPSFPFKTVCSFSPTPDGGLFVCAEPSAGVAGSDTGTALYSVRGPSLELAPPLARDPDWRTVEAVEESARARPMGRLSNVDPSEKSGLILCLNANFSRSKMAAGTRVRVLVQIQQNEVRAIGDVPLQPDGSFMAEVPADVPLGFELLDEHAKTVLRLAPSIWVRPGENRACIGCHESPNHAPRNVRPMAVSVPFPTLVLPDHALAQVTANHHNAR